MDFYNTTSEETNAGPEPSLVLAKATAMSLLGLSSFLLGILPLKLVSCLRWTPAHQPLVVSLLLCFGGGVLLFTTMMHLQPEVSAETHRLLDANAFAPFVAESGVDLAQLIFCSGFFLVYLIEEIVHLVLDTGHRHEDDEIALHRTMSVRKCGRAAVVSPDGMIPRISLRKTAPSPAITASTQVLFTKPEVLDPRGRMSGPLESVDSASSTSTPSVGKSFRGLFTVLALSFHSIFEGLAVGLQDSVSEVCYLSAAIATHKLVIAFCVGVELVCSRTKHVLVFLYVATFAVVTPVGIGLGLALSYGEHGAASDSISIASVVLQGMAAGTLLYVVFFEVLQKEKNKEHSGMIQLLSILAGFMVMFALHVFLGHSHDHGHSDHHFHHYHHGNEHSGNLGSEMEHDHHDHDHDHH